MRRLTVDKGGVGERLDSYLAARIDHVSRQKVQKLIASGKILVNGEKVQSKYAVAEGDIVTVDWTPIPVKTALEPKPLDLNIIYEDYHIIVLNKPAGISVHPGAGEQGVTLVEGLLYHVGSLPVSEVSEDGYQDDMAWARPGIVHRLDKDTTGVMVAAKTDLAHRELSRQFQKKDQLKRQYCALLDGTLSQESFFYESYLGRDPRDRTRFQSITPDAFHELPLRQQGGYRFAKSMFHVDKVFGDRISYVKVRLFTGRTHQIRVHARALGAPVIGDPVYGRPLNLPKGIPGEVEGGLRRISRQLLHAEFIEFNHPITGETVSFQAPLPKDFNENLSTLYKFFINSQKLK